LAAGPRHIASARTAKKTQLKKFYCCIRKLGRGHVTFTKPWPSNRCLQSRFLATAVSAGFTILAFSRHATIFMETILTRRNMQAHMTWGIGIYLINIFNFVRF
jgi:hypothetical protein